MTEFTVEDAARGERSVEERMTEKRERMSRSPNNTLESLGLDAELLARRASAPACPAERVHPDVEAVVFRGALSSEECARVVRSLDARDGWQSKCAKTSVRDAEGVPVPSEELAALLRARLDLPRSLPAAWRERVVRKDDRHLGDIGTEGTWAAARVNDVIRASRYRAGGHFAPHRDGVIQPREGERSFLTMLVYLTGDGGARRFAGGETAFVRDDGDGLEYGAFDADADVLARVAPEAGAVLVFLQDQLHSGLPVRPAPDADADGADGGRPLKYILVSEVLYERVALAEDGWDPEAVALLREAEAHEGVGEFQDAIRCYNRLRRLHPVFANHAGIP